MENIKYFNINNPGERVPLRSAVLKSNAGIQGLYMPDHIPVLPSRFFRNLEGMSLQKIAFEVSRAMLGGDIPDRALEKITGKAMNFEIPLRQLDEKLFVLELFHGPTLAFKDAGARFMAALFEYLLEKDSKKITILVATSGDTGSAVANAFLNRKGINVVILYPSGRVSAIQEKMLTTMGENITALEVIGDFDDCQRLVKESFNDKELNSELNITSANSINFARLLPQTFYYFYAISQMKKLNIQTAISVPSGNFGNLTAGVLSWKMGLNVDHFIASCNLNHAVVDYLNSGKYEPLPSRQTITNAMDVGNPSNFPRLLSLFNDDHEKFTSLIKGYWFTDKETIEAMRELQEKYGYQSDPHGAVAYLGLKTFKEKNNINGIFLETAHPVKFQSDVELASGRKVEVPESFKNLLQSEMRSVKIKADYQVLKNFLLDSLR